MTEDFSRREVLKGTGIAAAGMAGATAATGTASASAESNMQFTVHTDVSVGDDTQPFFQGAKDGMRDLANWIETYVPGVYRTYFYDDSDITDIEILSGDSWKNDVERDLPSAYQETAHFNLVLLSRSVGWELGHASTVADDYTEGFYSSDGSYGFVNNAHAVGVRNATGYKYGYNIAIHEFAHTCGLVHGDGSPDSNHNHVGSASIMATGYSHSSLDNLGTNLPTYDSYGYQWHLFDDVNLQHRFTRHAAYDLWDYLTKGDHNYSESDFEHTVDIEINDNPTNNA